MKIVFVSLSDHSYVGFPDITHLAAAFSECELVHISRQVRRGLHPSVEHISLDRYQNVLNDFHNWFDHLPIRARQSSLGKWSVARWFIVAAHLQDTKYKGPFFALDWDIAIFQSLQKLLPVFGNYDTLTPQSKTPYYFKNPEVLYEAIRWWKQAKLERPLGDMQVFYEFFQTSRQARLEMMEEHSGVLFDSNIKLLSDVYEADESGYKRLYWVDKKPMVKRRDNQQLVEMPWIHCWGRYKLKTKWLREMAGVL